MAKMTGLGKGLDALFSVNTDNKIEEIQAGEKIQNLKLSKKHKCFYQIFLFSSYYSFAELFLVVYII